jgi:hypothetical protein
MLAQNACLYSIRMTTSPQQAKQFDSVHRPRRPPKTWHSSPALLLIERREKTKLCGIDM